MSHSVKILALSPDTHETLVISTEKPDGYTFEPGQATHVSIAETGWRDEERPFTFTSLPNDPCLQFTIKTYPEHEGVTDHLRTLKVGDELIIDDPFGAIEYKGPGVFIAGGAGVTPFLSILRNLHAKGEASKQTLLFSNSKEEDIIAAAELQTILGERCRFYISDQASSPYQNGRIDKEVIKPFAERSGDEHFYVCGPKKMTEEICDILGELGVEPDRIVHEKAS